ncbi:Polypeptide N-acetylgalactosaminyltransferase [Trichostrongylus colubriformis]|uniref:Polypeptide N-acetylgalactosaminyltransferase n=1 Tax=Trichostrongylus colubriformis TaxID=6319 RepID=A0AAN8FNH2_TRICO
MFGRRKVAPFCAILGVWALVTLYFFGRSGPLPTAHSLLRDDEPIGREQLVNGPNIKLQDINNDFNVDEYKKVENDFDDHKIGDEDVKELSKVDEEMKEEAKEIEKMENEDQQRDRVMPAAVIVPVNEREPEVDLEKLAILNSPEEEEQKKALFEKYQFNGLLSDRIGYRRKIPDSRNSQCPHTFMTSLPRVSIIVCYFNESPSVLIRMVNSIIDRTPLDLIQEILLIDDSSEWPEASLQAADYQRKHPQWSMVKFLQTPSNQGLIRAKVFGARKARGEVLVFLDSHCEVNEEWLEPLLERIKEKPERVVCPIIDIIDLDTMKYVESPVCKGGVNWGLTFKWDYPPHTYFSQDHKNFIRPLKSATMAGGLFAIDRSYFFKIGSYDEGMDVWGAENVEISFRIWMCGGELEIIPCSRVGHIFRRKRPYGLASDSMGKNSIRAARVWLDEYLPEFFKARPYLETRVDYGDISSRLELKKTLQCKPFKWYLENIYPELLPGNIPDKLDIVNTPIQNGKKFQIRLANSTFCLTAESTNGRIARGNRVEMGICHGKRNQQWRWTENNEFRPMGSSRLCLDSLKGVSLLKCHNQRAHQDWQVTKDGKFYNKAMGKCIKADPELLSLAVLQFCSLASNFVVEEVTAE